MPYHNTNTLRSIPTYRPAALVFGPSATDLLIGDLRRALDNRPGYADMYAAARAKLGQANRTKPQWRRANQADALRRLNAVRAAIRANAKAIAAARTALLDAGRHQRCLPRLGGVGDDERDRRRRPARPMRSTARPANGMAAAVGRYIGHAGW